MNLSNARCETSAHPPKTITVADHAAWLQSLKDPEPVDQIDELVEELRAAEFEEKGARP